MIPLLRTVASALAAVLLGWLLPASAGAAVDDPLVAYTDDAAHIQAAPAHDRVERAPPTTQAALPLHLASDRGWSVAFAWPETIYNTRNSSYDQSVLLVPTDSSAAGGEATLSGAPEMVPGMGWERAYSIRATAVAAEAGTATVSRVTANKIAGDAFRDQVAGRLESEGFNIIGTEVSVKTPLGRRVIDILAEKNGGLVNFETKLGGSRYLPSQRAKDWWISNGGVDVLGNGTPTTFPTVVIRGPLP